MRTASRAARTWKRVARTGLVASLGLVLTACSALGIAPAATATPFPSPTVALFASVTPTFQLAATSTVPPASAASPAAPSATPVPPPTAVYLSGFPNAGAYAWGPVVSGLDLPVDVQNAGDGSGRLFVVEKPGRIVIVRNGRLLPDPFLDIRTEVRSAGTEQGLLGLAFHPDYAHSGVFFVYYIDRDGNTVVASFHASAADPDRADPTTQVDLLNVHQPYSNHNGGSLAFGPDGYLYIGLGDGGSEGDPLRTGQNTDTLLGKILRIDVDAGEPYTIPKDNPFALKGGLPEIWAVGLRNPWRFSFDRLTGDLYIGDVGQDSWEEVDHVPAGTPGGMNFGWSFFEGDHPYHSGAPAGVTFTTPVAEYSHADGCAITGGYVYRGRALPAFQGVYLFGDYCSGMVWGLIQTGPGAWQTQALFQTGLRITAFGQDEAGELYLVDYNSGSLYRLAGLQ